jgi:hypothetical protein
MTIMRCNGDHALQWRSCAAMAIMRCNDGRLRRLGSGRHVAHGWMPVRLETLSACAAPGVSAEIVQLQSEIVLHGNSQEWCGVARPSMSNSLYFKENT